jgi:hypothetical protein
LLEVLKPLLGYGVVGLWAAGASAAAIWLFRDNLAQRERYIAKCETDKKVNDARAEKTEDLARVLIGKLNPKRGGRRPTGTVPVDDE